jgi:arabinogalactan endo-1,4-beta-galactosidase
MKKIHSLIFLSLVSLSFGTCQTKKEQPSPSTPFKYYLGADLSYVNEMEDCDGKFRVEGKEVDPFQLFANKGASMVRVRLWHTPSFGNYSNLADVKKTIRRAKEKGMRVLLDFHYSDTWADPQRQLIPAAWKNITDVALLGDSVFQYTLNTLMNLHAEGLMPEMVQVGNEINAEVMQYQEQVRFPINWSRNVALLNKGIAGVRKAAEMSGKNVEVMLHVAQPDEAFWWYDAARRNNIADYDWIGLSYYTQWSKFNLTQMKNEVARLKRTFSKRVMIVEAGYPYTLQNADFANNLLDTVSQLPGYEVSITDQKRFMVDMTKALLEGGGEGVLYWEPAWISTRCRTQWAQGSHWDNATFFNHRNNNEALPVFDYYNEAQYDIK